MDEIVKDWAEELSASLGRSAAIIRTHGLSAYDFSSHDEVEVLFPDGSTAHFKFAFFVVSEARKLVAVFTEHCGYWVIPSWGLKVTRVRRELFYSESHE